MTAARKAAQELLVRRRARESVFAYAEAIDVPGRAATEDDNAPLDARPVLLADHHRLVLQKMDECSKRDTGRLMIMMPPGSAKSTYASVVFPSRFLGANPGKRFILASYGATLAVKMGRRTKSICNQPRYRGIWGATLNADSRANDNFTLSNGSEYMSCGILGGVTGNRADGIVIDDPIKGRDQADSEIIRQKTWDAYEDDIKTRLIPGGWLVIIQTRWHEDDLAGRILPEGWAGESGMIECRDGNTWEVLCLQAQCEVDDDPLGRARGEFLWPEWFTKKHWEQFKQNARTWASLFQQRPTPLDGDLFNPDMMPTIDALPAGRITWVRGWDVAATEGGGDWTDGVKMGRHEDGRFIIADDVYGQYGPAKRDALILATTQGDGHRCKADLPQDPAAAGKSQVVGWVKMLAGYPVVWSTESGDKSVRAEGFAAQVNIGNVYLLRGDWNARYKSQLRGFPNAKWNDAVDASSRAFNRLLLLAGKMSVSDKLLQKVRR